ncbi:aminoglycoside phosphotransferase family protein [Streptomyces sp. NPDC058217]|uniref:aminoglycoside phosphotransferase family protein n=1 Tax=Streptomyces sp. NPDC058217 TaxID=3346384 RepID=UPI0036E35909
MIGLPEAFARSTVEREGERGAAWLAELPGIVEELLGRWGCVPDGEVMHGGVGVIIPVRRRAEGTAVLKVSFPHPGNVHEPDAFSAWGGRGAVLLYERDDERFAMLLERIRTSTLAEVDDGDEVVTIAGRISRRLAITAPPGLPRLREQADAWEAQLRKDAGELTHTLSRYVVDAAVATVRELGRVQPDTLIHGDLHARNILRAHREPWLAVDPKGKHASVVWLSSPSMRASHQVRSTDRELSKQQRCCPSSPGAITVCAADDGAVCGPWRPLSPVR